MLNISRDNPHSVGAFKKAMTYAEELKSLDNTKCDKDPAKGSVEIDRFSGHQFSSTPSDRSVDEVSLKFDAKAKGQPVESMSVREYADKNFSPEGNVEYITITDSLGRDRLGNHEKGDLKLSQTRYSDDDAQYEYQSTEVCFTHEGLIVGDKEVQKSVHSNHETELSFSPGSFLSGPSQRESDEPRWGRGSAPPGGDRNTLESNGFTWSQNKSLNKLKDRISEKNSPDYFPMNRVD